MGQSGTGQRNFGPVLELVRGGQDPREVGISGALAVTGLDTSFAVSPQCASEPCFQLGQEQLDLRVHVFAPLGVFQEHGGKDLLHRVVEGVDRRVQEGGHEDVRVEVVRRNDARLQLEKHQPVVRRGLGFDYVIDLDQPYSLRQFCMRGQNGAVSIVQEAVELLGIQDVGDGSVGYFIAEVVADGGEDEVFSRVSGHSTLLMTVGGQQTYGLHSGPFRSQKAGWLRTIFSPSSLLTEN